MLRWVHRALSHVRTRFTPRPGVEPDSRANPLSSFTRSFDS
jgi:hypothetical protein